MQQNILPSQGNTTYLEALDVAVQREIKANYMYKVMAKYAKSEHLKNKLEFMAAEEMNHRENLEDLYKKISGASKNFASDVIFPNEGTAVARITVEELMKLAIEKEKEANEFYVDLSKKSEDAGMAEIFRYLAEEETTHKRILEQELNFLKGHKPMDAEASAEMVPGVYKEWW